MRGNGHPIVGTLIVQGALRQDYEEDESTGEWVTKTYSVTFTIEDRGFVGIPMVGEKVNIGPEEVALDYWAIVSGVEQLPHGKVRVMAEVDPTTQLKQLEENEESDECEVLTVYGHAVELSEELIDERRTPLSELEDQEGY